MTSYTTLIVHKFGKESDKGSSLLTWLSTFNSPSSARFFSSWKPNDQTPCNWNYIKCNEQSFVSEITITSIYLPTTFPIQFLSFQFLTVLILSNTNLSGEIPSLVGNTTLLVTLDLSLNNLTGSIPPEIGKLSMLQSLSLTSNNLQGEIPKEIGNCTQLQKLELYDNQLVGKIPVEIGRLTSLEIFRAGGNLIDGEIPVQISNCTRLSFLGLADTGIMGQIPPTLGALKNLKTLSIYTANLSGEIPPELGNCSSLESLFIYQNQISGEIPTEFGYLKSLKRLLLWQNNLRGTIPGDLGNCSSLTVIDLSLNLLSGEIPQSLQNIFTLEGLLLSDNNISGTIPEYIGNFSSLKQLELDNNNISGQIPSTIGLLKELTLFFAWQNHLQGVIPNELANCEKLQDLDLSNNVLTGPIPRSLFNLRNLTKLLLISNHFSGKIPAEIGNCSSLIRLRLGANMLDEEIPSEIGMLGNLRFLELSENQFNGRIPTEIGNCKQLEMVDLHGNKLRGHIPLSFVSLLELNVLDLSMNEILGNIPESIGNLVSLNKLVLSGNAISGSIPKSLGRCKDLQLLDVAGTELMVQSQMRLHELFNRAYPGKLFEIFKACQHGHVSQHAGRKPASTVPDSKFFQDLPSDSFAGNQALCFTKNKSHSNNDIHRRKYVRHMTVLLVLIFIVTLIMLTAGAMYYKRKQDTEFEKIDEEKGLQWKFTPYQKFNFSVEDVVAKLCDSNIVGRGCSGTVYRVETPTRQVIAKRLWPKKRGGIAQRDFFSAEVTTQGSIRHKNIVRLLGCCDNGKTRLFLFDYISNGSLAGLLHEKKMFLDWNSRYNIIMGAAQGLAYLHHDCIPPIVHRDIKSNNILVGPTFEAFLADFGLAKLVSSSDSARASDVIAGSYGYIAPEYGYSLKMTEKSDVYSYGIVILEVLTGMEPTDPRIPDGKHIVPWVYEELRTKLRDFTSIVDQQLLLQSSTQTEEMLQVLGIALLCVNSCPDDRPKMRDVIAMLEGVKHENEESEKPNSPRKETVSNPSAADHCSSFSRSSRSLIISSSHSQ
ncbi:hypothetical protein ACS0TY_014258 [Phlomoides rotata]